MQRGPRRVVVVLFFDNHLIRYVVYSNGNDGIIDRGQLLFLLCSIDIRVLSPCNGGTFRIVREIVTSSFGFDTDATATVDLKKVEQPHSNLFINVGTYFIASIASSS